MDFKLVSKNNLGAVATLFLVILLSHARFFDFLIDTPLGRAILILFILGISYANKILGVVAVLFIIIAFNNSDIGYLEGYTGLSTPSNTTNTTNTTTTNTTNTTTPNTTTPNTTTPNTTTPNTTTAKAIKDKLDVSKTGDKSVSKTEGNGIEGFNTTDRENVILRGKRSSEIPVYSNARNQDDNVEPSDKSVFAGSYSSV
jgi:hypothetical protein